MISTEQGRRAYDVLAGRYEEIHFYTADLGHELVSCVAPPRGARVLDVGAGRGAVGRAAVARGCAVTAVDSSAGMVARLAAGHREMLVLHQDAGELHFPDGSFDLVTAGFLMQDLDDPRLALAEFHRVLVPGGTIALSLELQGVGRLGWLHDLTREFLGCVTRAPLAPDHLDDLVTETGFAEQRRTPVTAVRELHGPAALWDWIALQGVPEALDTLPMGEAVTFRERFFRGARDMHRNGGITLEFAATVHTATRP